MLDEVFHGKNQISTFVDDSGWVSLGGDAEEKRRKATIGELSVRSQKGRGGVDTRQP